MPFGNKAMRQQKIEPQNVNPSPRQLLLGRGNNNIHFYGLQMHNEQEGNPAQRTKETAGASRQTNVGQPNLELQNVRSGMHRKETGGAGFIRTYQPAHLIVTSSMFVPVDCTSTLRGPK